MHVLYACILHIIYPNQYILSIHYLYQLQAYLKAIVFIVIHGYPHEYPRKQFLWISMDIHGYPRKNPWIWRWIWGRFFISTASLMSHLSWFYPFALSRPLFRITILEMKFSTSEKRRKCYHLQRDLRIELHIIPLKAFRSVMGEPKFYFFVLFQHLLLL